MLINRFPDKDSFCRLADKHNVIPVCAEILADTETPVSLLRKIYKDRGPAFLLESVSGGERWGRYSFLSASAICQVRVYRDVVEIQNNGFSEKIAHNGDPLSVLRTRMKQYNPPFMEGLPRFWCGMVGYLTYEMVSFFEAIPNNLPKDKPIAHFMIPDELLIFDNIRNTLLIVVIVFKDENTDSETAYKSAAERLEALMKKESGQKESGQLSVVSGQKESGRLSVVSCQKESGQWSVVSGQKSTDHCSPTTDHLFTLEPVEKDEVYRSTVKRVKEYILAGDIIQAVISQPFVCSPAPDLWSLYRAQRFINPSPYLFFLHLDNTALIGSSPETMVRLENRIATLRPIAGTRPRGKTEQDDRALADELLKDEKERAEHLMLVDLGRNDLGRVAEIGTVQVTDLMIVERYSHVMHLVSNICCDLKPEYDAWDLLKSTFPAGTLSGAPKVRAMEIIAEMEGCPRGPYGGAVGYVSFHGNMDMAITIRTACVEDGKLTLRAGAGIVADSDPERERIETVNKAKAIQKALKMIVGNDK